MKKDIIDTLNKNNGVMKSRQLEDYGFSRTYISNAVDNGLIVREDRGIYVTKDVLEDEMYMFQLKNSKAIFCNNSSLYLWNLTEKTPDKYDVAVPINYNPHRIKKCINTQKQ